MLGTCFVVVSGQVFSVANFETFLLDLITLFIKNLCRWGDELKQRS